MPLAENVLQSFLRGRKRKAQKTRHAIGRSMSLSIPRRLIIDLMHASRRSPLVPIERRMHLAELITVRNQTQPRISWCAIFVKAYARVAARRPELRRAFLSRPWARLYESADNVATVMIERDFRSEPAVLPAHLRSPERMRLEDIHAWLRQHQRAPIEDIGSYRRALRVTSLPTVVRRMLWRFTLDWSGSQRVRNFGTFGLSATAGSGAETLAVRSPLTTTLHYGVVDRHGVLPVRITFDHRALDGATIARGLAELEEALTGEVLDELRLLAESAGERNATQTADAINSA
jgi:hypothetical protein